MQRRAAAAYFLFFLVVSVAAYAYIGVAESQRPEVQLTGPELTNDSTLTDGEQTYTVSNIHLSGGGGHGGGGSMVADLSWTNNSSRYTATIASGSTVSRTNTASDATVTNSTSNATMDSTTYNVAIENSTSTLTLTAEQNTSRLLSENSSVEDTTVTVNGTQYVVVRGAQNESDSLRPLAEWLPEPERINYTESDSFVYPAESGTRNTTIANVTNNTVTVEWTAPRSRTVELSEGGNVTLADGRYFAHFLDHSTVRVVSVDQYPQYQEALAAQSYFHERKNGLWGVSILSGIASALMLGMAYLPNRG